MKQRCSTFHENILLNCSTSCILNGGAPESVFKVAQAMCSAQLLQQPERTICESVLRLDEDDPTHLSAHCYDLLTKLDSVGKWLVKMT